MFAYFERFSFLVLPPPPAVFYMKLRTVLWTPFLKAEICCFTRALLISPNVEKSKFLEASSRTNGQVALLDSIIPDT